MAPVLVQSQQIPSLSGTAVPDIRELVAYCPGCKTLETLWFNNGWLMQTRKFNQRGGQVFHDCGTTKCCRLYRPC